MGNLCSHLEERKRWDHIWPDIEQDYRWSKSPDFRDFGDSRCSKSLFFTFWNTHYLRKFTKRATFFKKNKKVVFWWIFRVFRYTLASIEWILSFSLKRIPHWYRSSKHTILIVSQCVWCLFPPQNSRIRVLCKKVFKAIYEEEKMWKPVFSDYFLKNLKITFVKRKTWNSTRWE